LDSEDDEGAGVWGGDSMMMMGASSSLSLVLLLLLLEATSSFFFFRGAVVVVVVVVVRCCLERECEKGKEGSTAHEAAAGHEAAFGRRSTLGTRGCFFLGCSSLGHGLCSKGGGAVYFDALTLTTCSPTVRCSGDSFSAATSCSRDAKTWLKKQY
jgi:hypothetical protein